MSKKQKLPSKDNARKQKQEENRKTRTGPDRRRKLGASNETSPAKTSEHALKIAKYHTLEKQIARATEQEKKLLIAEQKKLGGLSLYQQASLQGARHGETSKWLIQTVEANYGGRKERRLLDVGAIAGTSYAKYKSITATYIDLNPAADHVIKADFLTYPLPEKPFDIVCLSLVVNFVGDLDSRSASIPFSVALSPTVLSGIILGEWEDERLRFLHFYLSLDSHS